MQRLLDDPSALKPLPPVKLADVERPAPVERPAAPEPATAGPQAGNGHDTVDSPSPFAPDSQVASLQEAPGSPADVGPPTQPVPFAVGGDTRGPWLPSELRPPGDEPLGPAPAPPGPPPASAPPAVAPDPSTRPSEWGRAVFEPDKADGERSRFGRRR